MRSTTLLATALLFTVMAGKAAAWTADPLSLEEMTYVADRIVTGTVLESESRFVLDGQAIFTYYEVAVDETLKG